MIYQWKTGCRLQHLSAQAAGELCDGLSAAGCLSAQRLVDVSRPEDAPLHGAFEWDDAIAGEEWRKSQARHIIHSIVIVPEESETETPIRAFFKVEKAEPDYEPVRAILRSESRRAMLLKTALDELNSFRRKYAALDELSSVFAAIEAAIPTQNPEGRA